MKKMYTHVIITVLCMGMSNAVLSMKSEHNNSGLKNEHTYSQWDYKTEFSFPDGVTSICFNKELSMVACACAPTAKVNVPQMFILYPQAPGMLKQLPIDCIVKFSTFNSSSQKLGIISSKREARIINLEDLSVELFNHKYRRLIFGKNDNYFAANSNTLYKLLPDSNRKLVQQVPGKNGVFNVSDGKIRSIDVSRFGEEVQVYFSNDQEWIALIQKDTVTITSHNAHKFSTTITCPHRVTCVRFHPQNKHLFVGLMSGDVYIINLEKVMYESSTSQNLIRILQWDNPIRGLFFNEKGNWFAVASLYKAILYKNFSIKFGANTVA